MSATRKSSRITKKTSINVKLNISDGIEFVDANGVVENMDEEEEWTAEIGLIDGDEIDDEELIANPDGTMSIKLTKKSNSPKKEVAKRGCEKCGLSFPTAKVKMVILCPFCGSVLIVTISIHVSRHCSGMKIFAVICRLIKLPTKMKRIMPMSMYSIKNTNESAFVAMKRSPPLM